MRPRVALLCVALVTLAACGAPDNGLPESLPNDGNRVFEAHDQSGDFTKQITVPSGTTKFAIKLACLADGGDMELAVGPGSAGVPCDKGGSGYADVTVGSGEDTRYVGPQTITVTVPDGARWSAAVDAK